MDTMKRPALIGAAVVATVMGASMLWLQQSKGTPTAAPSTMANASPTAAKTSPAPVAAAAPVVAAVTATEPRPVTPVTAEPWAASERQQKKVRESARDNALKSLAMPLSTFCKAEGRRNLANALSTYFEQRGMQQRQYAANWGDAGKSFITAAWSGSADDRVENLMRTVYAAGYFRLDDFQSSQRPAMAKLLAGVKQTRDKPCTRRA